MSLPKYEIIRRYDDDIVFECHDECLRSLFPVIYRQIMLAFGGQRCSPETVIHMKMKIDLFLKSLILQGYLHNFYNNEWTFNTIKFVTDMIGYNLNTKEHYKKSHVGGEDYNMYASCLLLDDCSLCEQIKNLPEHIYNLQNIFNSKDFNFAVEKYETELIEKIAKIPAEI
jgi:hypothetical protein